MRNVKQITALLIFSISLSFCSSDESTNDENIEDEPVSTDAKLIKSIDRGLKVNYSYVNNILSSASGSNENTSFDMSYSYDSNGNVTEETMLIVASNTTNVIINYDYDDQNRLISYTRNPDQITELSYEGNIVTVDYINSPLSLEVVNNRVTKLTRQDFYKLFTYDTKGNLVRYQEFDNNNTLINQYDYRYDDNVNPFFNQLESTYLARFIGFFAESGDSYHDSLYFDFPYLPNNLLSLSMNNEPLNSYTLSYDSDNYPISIIETEPDNSTNDYFIQY